MSATRFGTVSTTQLILRSGTPVARPSAAMIRLHRSIEYPAGWLLVSTYENGSESAEKATVITFAALILASVSGALCARTFRDSRAARTKSSGSERFTGHLAALKERHYSGRATGPRPVRRGIIAAGA